MGKTAFFGAFAGVKVDGVVKAATEALVRWDPQGASEAQLRVMEQNLDVIGGEVASVSAQYTEAVTAYNAANALNTQRLRAAEIMQGKLAAASDDARPGLTLSLEKLVALAESSQTELTQYKEDKDSIASDLEELKESYDAAAKKRLAAKKQLEEAQRGMARAERDRERAEGQAEASRAAAGLAGGGDDLNIALNAMKSTTQKTNEAAEAARLKAAALRPVDVETEDANIASAMAEASGSADNHPLTLEERLAALKSSTSAQTSVAA
jgi:chromosome segregation ATPase